jgi:tetratricopeptide (TPR) repeat protein
MTRTKATTGMTAKPAALAQGTGGYRTLIVALSLFVFASSGCSKAPPPPTKDQILSRAHEALLAEQYTRAEKAYREVLRLTPNDPVAVRQLGIIYLDQGQLIQAYPLLEQAADLQPEDPELQLKFGQASLALGQLTQARDLAQQVLNKKPGDETALLLMVDTAVTPDEIKDAQQLIESLRAKDQDRASYHLALGMFDLRLKNDARAESEFKAALALDPKSSGAHSALGRLYWSRNDLKAADEALKAAADLSPLRSPMQLRYVDFKLRQGALPEAKAILEGINSKLPDYLPPRVALMKLACAERQDDDCRGRVQNILAQDPINFDAIFQDSVLNLTKGDAATAVKKLEYLNNAYREKPQLLYQLAVAYLAFAGHASPVDARDSVGKAASRLTEAIKLDPRFDAAILTYAELQIRSGNAAGAIDSLAHLINEQPQLANAHYLLAAAYRAVQKENEALAVLRQMAQLFPKNPQPPFAAGSILLAQSLPAEARKEFERSADISPDYLPATEAIVNLDLSENQYAEAMDRVEKQIARDAVAQLWGLRAKIYLAQQDVTHAEADLLKAIELDPKLEPAYLLLAQLYVSSNRPDQAIEKLNSFVSKNKTVPALMQLAAIQERVKNFSAARDAYEKALTVSTNFAPALNNLAVLYSERLGQLDTANDFARKARETAPDDPSIADTLGWILFKKGDYRNALQLLQQAAVKLTDKPDLQFHLGMAHYMLGDEASARAALQKAADASADHLGIDEARQRLALLMIDVGPENAAGPKELETALRTWPKDPVALMRLAQLQLRQGDIGQAVKTLEGNVADNPLYRPALRQLALLYGERPADDPKTYELVQKARQSFPGDDGIAKMLGILSYRRQLYPQSAQLLEEATRTRKDDPELLYYLGAALQQLKQWKECKVALDRALSLSLSSGLVEKAKISLVECSDLATP